MKILSLKVYNERNIYYHKKCIRLNLDLEGFSEVPSSEICNFNEILVHTFPELTKHRCGIDDDRSFIKSLTQGTYLAQITEHIILAVHNMIGLEISYGKAKEICGNNYYVIYQYIYKSTGIEAAKIAVDFINSLLNKELFNLDLRLHRLREILMSEVLGVSTINICNEAKKRGIPILKIGDNGMFQLGYGKYSKMIQATLGSDTSAIAVNIAHDKLLEKELLTMHLLPVLKGMRVASKEDCLIGAKNIGYPVVLKPQFGNIGRGAIVNIKDENELSNAYELLILDYEDIIVEKHINGRDYKVCSVYGDIVAVSEKMPPYILGDGISDENHSTCVFEIDCTDSICDENIQICKRSASAIGLDICEIHLICKDISKPFTDEVLIEINAAPDIRMHQNPCIGTKHNVAGHIVDKLFEHSPKNIPLVAVTGTNGKTTTTRLIAHILSLSGYIVGMTTSSGIYIDGECIFKGDTTGPKSALAVLTNKNVDAAVLETARGGIIREGLAYDLADVGVITNITEDHLGLDEVETIEQLAKVKALVGESVKEGGYVIINGDDKMSISILHRLKSNLIIFSSYKDNGVMQENIKSGGYGVYEDKGNLIIQKNTNCQQLMAIKDIGISMKGILKYNIENAMSACSAAIALGIDYDTIRNGLMSFYCNEVQNPGRFNMYSVNDIMVILDYGHNIEGYRCVLDGLKHIKHNKLIGVIGVPGDRLDSDIIEVGKCAGENFDNIFIKEDKVRRGRAKGEVADLLEKGVLRSKFYKMNIKKILDETEAFKRALNFAKAGDIVIIFFEKYEPLVDIVKSKINEVNPKTELLVKSQY